jgi:hypothetical protein
MLNTMVLILLLVATAVWGGAPVGQTFTVNPGTFVLGQMPLAASGAGLGLAKLCWSATGFDSPTQTWHYTWQDSLDAGTTWQDWAGAVTTGGPKHDLFGNPITLICTQSNRREPGPSFVRLRGTLTSATPIDITITLESR